jgi:hypothetical protein
VFPTLSAMRLAEIMGHREWWLVRAAGKKMAAWF